MNIKKITKSQKRFLEYLRDQRVGLWHLRPSDIQLIEEVLENGYYKNEC